MSFHREEAIFTYQREYIGKPITDLKLFIELRAFVELILAYNILFSFCVCFRGAYARIACTNPYIIAVRQC